MIKIVMMSHLINEIKQKKLLEKTKTKSKVFEQVLNSSGKFDARVRGFHITINLKGGDAENVQDKLAKKGYYCGNLFLIDVLTFRDFKLRLSFVNPVHVN